MRSRPRLLILDFDGTMTDAEREGAPFREGYLEDLAALTERPLAWINAAAERYEAVVAAESGSHGWVFDGRIVAPASVDPYLRMMPVARLILDEVGAFLSPRDRDRLLDGILYKYNYQKTRTAFREGAGALLRGLGARSDLLTAVVTNSHTEPVQGKIKLLDEAEGGGVAWLLGRVYGRARKYVLDDRFDAVPESLDLPGLPRPVLLRRRAYFEVLDRLRAEAGVQWAEVRVAGDIFELDLSLPISLGASVALIANPHTPAYERAYLDAHPRGVVLERLDQVPGWLDAT